MSIRDGRGFRSDSGDSSGRKKRTSGHRKCSGRGALCMGTRQDDFKTTKDTKAHEGVAGQELEFETRVPTF